MRWTRMAGCGVLLLLAFVFTAARPLPGPPVVHAEVPVCDLSFRARSYGRVLIRVTINREGKVTSSTVEHSVALATPCAEAAAKKWIFAPSDREGNREALLSFFFLDDPKETDEQSHVISSFDDPWTVRLAYAQSTIQRLPRENGAIPEKRCPVHDKVMAVEVVRTSPGLHLQRLRSELPEEQRRHPEGVAYQEAREKLFPEAHGHVVGGCLLPKPKAEVYYCQACREAERAWLASHPDIGSNK